MQDSDTFLLLVKSYFELLKTFLSREVFENLDLAKSLYNKDSFSATVQKVFTGDTFVNQIYRSLKR